MSKSGVEHGDQALVLRARTLSHSRVTENGDPKGAVFEGNARISEMPQTSESGDFSSQICRRGLRIATGRQVYPSWRFVDR